MEDIISMNLCSSNWKTMSKTGFRVLPHTPFKQLFSFPVSLPWTSNPLHGLPVLGNILALMPLIFRKDVPSFPHHLPRRTLHRIPVCTIPGSGERTIPQPRIWLVRTSDDNTDGLTLILREEISSYYDQPLLVAPHSRDILFLI